MKALVVDDSALMRRQIGDILTNAGFDVSTARTGLEAITRVPLEKPDVVTLDINMPEMDGLTCLSRIMTECPVPVVMISSLTDDGALATLEAIALGAVDYMQKPGGTVSANMRSCEEIIVEKVTAAARARPRSAATLRQRMQARRETILRGPPRPTIRNEAAESLTLIGASTGGPAVLEDLLSALPAHYPMPVMVAQHMPASVTKHLPNAWTAFAPCPWWKCAARPSWSPARSISRGAMPTW